MCEMLDVATAIAFITQKPSIAGKWNVSPGALTLAVEKNSVTGSYPFSGGKLEGVLAEDGRTVTGKWTQSNGASGGFVLVMSANGKQVEGRRWTGNKEDDVTNRTWSGNRID
jgi:hypothetical protein